MWSTASEPGLNQIITVLLFWLYGFDNLVKWKPLLNDTFLWYMFLVLYGSSWNFRQWNPFTVCYAQPKDETKGDQEFLLIMAVTVLQISLTSLVNQTSTNGDSDSSLSSFRSIRTLRALRPLRAISRWEGMKVTKMLKMSPLSTTWVCLATTLGHGSF